MGIYVIQESIPVECGPPTCPTASIITRCFKNVGEGVGPKVNKFEHVSSLDYQMSAAGMGMGMRVPTEDLCKVRFNASLVMLT